MTDAQIALWAHGYLMQYKSMKEPQRNHFLKALKFFVQNAEDTPSRAAAIHALGMIQVSQAINLSLSREVY